jgi:hypothetical protein
MIVEADVSAVEKAKQTPGQIGRQCSKSFVKNINYWVL